MSVVLHFCIDYLIYALTIGLMHCLFGYALTRWFVHWLLDLCIDYLIDSLSIGICINEHRQRGVYSFIKRVWLIIDYLIYALPMWFIHGLFGLCIHMHRQMGVYSFINGYDSAHVYTHIIRVHVLGMCLHVCVYKYMHWFECTHVRVTTRGSPCNAKRATRRSRPTCSGSCSSAASLSAASKGSILLENWYAHMHTYQWAMSCHINGVCHICALCHLACVTGSCLTRMLGGRSALKATELRHTVR